MNVLVILGHPRIDSFCGALADAYCDGARRAGVQLRRLQLAEMDFDPDVHVDCPSNQTLEHDLGTAREAMLWADHLVFVYPTWWGTVPALMKGFLDRILTPGFSFVACEGGIGYEGLLGGRSAQLITTMDTPPIIHRTVYRQPGRNAMARATLGFCGIDPVRSLTLGPMRDSNAGQRQRWLDRANRAGQRLKHGRVSPGEKLARKLTAWLKAMRLQFYPMTLLAFAVGAVATAEPGTTFTSPVFWTGYLCIFLLLFATVLINELVDFPSDRNNRYYSLFTGGSRVLVEGLLRPGELRIGIVVVLALLVMSALALIGMSPAPGTEVTLALGTLSVLALGYTLPPLKLSYRGMGEIDVAFTHSVGAIVCGYVFLGGSWNDSLPWLLSVPLLLAILPSITLSGIPDLEADAAAGKRTLAVRFGHDGALWIALISTLLAAATALIWQIMQLAGGAFEYIAFVVIPHALALSWMLHKRIRSNLSPGRIDGLMAVSLSYILWFALVPLLRL